jgi:hypothetical protein
MAVALAALGLAAATLAAGAALAYQAIGAERRAAAANVAAARAEGKVAAAEVEVHLAHEQVADVAADRDREKARGDALEELLDEAGEPVTPGRGLSVLRAGLRRAAAGRARPGTPAGPPPVPAQGTAGADAAGRAPGRGVPGGDA